MSHSHNYKYDAPRTSGGLVGIVVTCADCKFEWVKRKSHLPTWNGRCRSCAQKIATRVEGRTKGGRKPNPNTVPKTLKGRPCGEKHYNWKGGVTSQSRYERTVFIKTVKPVVLKRDNYTCTSCGVYGGNLHIDHIKSWANYPELRFVEENCNTLCMSCHYQKTFNRIKPDGIIWGNNITKQYVVQ